MKLLFGPEQTGSLNKGGGLNILQQNIIIFALLIYLYNTIRRNVTVKGILHCVLAIASVLSLNYCAFFTMFVICNVYF